MALTEVAPGVWTATARTWSTVTTVVVAPDGGALVVDPGLAVAELADLAAEITARGWRVVAGFSTHPHWDHVLWTRAWADVPRWATPAAVRFLDTARPDVLRAADETARGHDHDLVGRLTALSPGTTHLPWSGPRAEVVTHPAHAVGHAALVLPDTGVLLAGDMLSDLEIPLLDLAAADPVGDYRSGLDTLERAAAQAGVRAVVPGHGHVGDHRELARRLAADRRYLDALAAGVEPDDDRLGTEWLAAEHRRQAASGR
ncbi:MBL fold metallo-hydrolase [Cellulomonas hominis]